MHSVHSFELSCAATDLAEWPRPYFEFFGPPHGREECKEWGPQAETFLSDALRCSEVREERKERPFFLSSREHTGRRPEKSTFCPRRLSGGKT